MGGVERALLAVDPAEAQGDFEGFLVGHAGDGRPLFRVLEPDAVGRGVVVGQPPGECFAGEKQHRLDLRSHRITCNRYQSIRLKAFVSVFRHLARLLHYVAHSTLQG
jgi:hypothetical protein